MIDRVLKISGVAAASCALFWSVAAPAQQAGPSPGQQRQASRPGPAAAPKEKPSPFGNMGGNSKEPIKIDADRLDVFDRENKAVFSGNVVAVQGESTIRCTKLTVFYERGQQGGAKPAPSAAGGQSENAIKQIDCAGPVTVVSKDQIGTGDNAVFDQVANKIVMTGNVKLSQCQNVTTGDRLVYDLNTGVANIESAASPAGQPGRVRALFMPGGENKQAQQGCQTATAAPAPAQAKPDSKAAGRPRAQTN
jgi:lipopolysaccharide export system protein LptA